MHEPRRFVAASGSVHLREQPLRDGDALDFSESVTDLGEGRELRHPAVAVDGMDVVGGGGTAPNRLARGPQSGKPYFLSAAPTGSARTPCTTPELYRDKAEVEEWKAKDPIPAPGRASKKAGRSTPTTRAASTRQVAGEIEEAVAFAEAGAWEPVEDLTRYVAPEPGAARARHPADRQRRDQLPRGDERSHPQGAAARHAGLPDGRGRRPLWRLLCGQQGPASGVRTRANPRHAAVGVRLHRRGIGAALGGMRPIVEIMTVNFSLLALDQILNNAATMLHMSGSQFNVPLVIRMATGAGRQLAAQHSHSLEGWYAHIPGIKVLAPATLEDARGMLSRRCRILTRC